MSEGESLATLLGRLQVAGGVELAAVVSTDGFLIEATHVDHELRADSGLAKLLIGKKSKASSAQPRKLAVSAGQ